MPVAFLTDDSFAYGIEDELSRIVQVQFLQDMTAMGLDGIGANVKSCCYFLICFPLGQKLKDLPLTACEQVIAIDGALLLENTNVILSQNTTHLRAKERLILCNRL